MQILKDFSLNNLKIIVEKYAKFQKVILLYDDNISLLEIEKMHESVKEICIFNKMDLRALDENEIHNGYKLLIFACSANSFLKLNLNLEDFVNVFIPTSAEILPFFLNSKFKIDANFLSCAELEINMDNLNITNTNFIFLKKGLDIAAFSSFYFNNFLSCLNSILLGEELKFKNNNIDFLVAQTELEFLKNDFEYEDVKILKQLNLDYKFLPYLDYYFLLAFSLLITAIKYKKLTMTDVYKQSKENYNLRNSYYAKIYDEAFYNLIDINFLSLKQMLTFSFKNLVKINLNELSYEEKKFLVEKLKEYCKNSDSFFAYLYLFNIFD